MQRFTKRAEAFYALFCAAAFTIFQDVFFPRRGQSHTFCCRQTKKQAFTIRRSCKKAHTDKKTAPRVKPLSADAADPQKMTKYPECGFLYHSSNWVPRSFLPEPGAAPRPQICQRKLPDLFALCGVVERRTHSSLRRMRSERNSLRR